MLCCCMLCSPCILTHSGLLTHSPPVCLQVQAFEWHQAGVLKQHPLQLHSEPPGSPPTVPTPVPSLVSAPAPPAPACEPAELMKAVAAATAHDQREFVAGQRDDTCGSSSSLHDAGGGCSWGQGNDSSSLRDAHGGCSRGQGNGGESHIVPQQPWRRSSSASGEGGGRGTAYSDMRFGASVFRD